MDNFFSCNNQHNNFSRTFKKGKSFKFSEWNADDTYNNDEFVQDWVTYNGVLYVCEKNCTGIVPTDTNYWTKVLSGTDIHTLWWDEFNGKE